VLGAQAEADRPRGLRRRRHVGEISRQPPRVARIDDLLVLNAIRGEELYVLTHRDGSWRGEVETRVAAILAALDKAPGHRGEQEEHRATLSLFGAH